jgi:hypothetical protein
MNDGSTAKVPLMPFTLDGERPASACSRRTSASTATSC